MKRLSITLAGALAAIWLGSASTECGAATHLLGSPNDISNPTTVTFDGYPQLTVANTLYQSQGITLTRDDASAVFIYEWTPIGRVTVSPPNVLATVTDFVLNQTWSTHLNVLASGPLYALGAYFGNDQYDTDFAFERLSVYGASGQLLGSVQLAVNNNTSVDQFIGIESDIPFTRARFENLGPSGAPSTGLAVCIDNLSFTTIPEPGSVWLAGLGLAGVLVGRKRKG